MMHRRRRQPLLAAALSLAVILIGCSSDSGTAPRSTVGTILEVEEAGGRAGADDPNIVFVLVDDMSFEELQYMPHVKELVADQGMSFQNYFASVSLCCPARASILRGQYSHNTGVLTNTGENGGFETAYRLGIEQDTVATSLHDAGYRTGLFGKYLNGYPKTAGHVYIPPGWDTWSSSNKGNPYDEYNYTLNENGKSVDYGDAPEDYGTDVYTRQAREFITKAAADNQPFFAYLSVYAPHQPATPAPRHAELFPDAKAPRTPAFDESDVSDKPAYVKGLPPITTKRQAYIDRVYRKRLQSLQAVDEGIAAIFDTLIVTGKLDSTYVVFTSDNGFHFGAHRMGLGKDTAYETDIHLPLLVRGPSVAPGSMASPLVGNIDLASTFAELGGTTMADDPDGRSLVPILSGAAPSPWRSAYLVEHWTATSTTNSTPGDVQLEPDDSQGGTDSGPGGGAGGTTTTAKAADDETTVRVPEFQGIRTESYTYVEYATGERELYDLAKDPDQLTNIAATADPALVAGLRAQLESLRQCKAAACRTAEESRR